MSSWMKTLQSGANKVGNEAAKLKLYAEISLLKGDIKSLKAVSYTHLTLPTKA